MFVKRSIAKIVSVIDEDAVDEKKKTSAKNLGAIESSKEDLTQDKDKKVNSGS